MEFTQLLPTMSVAAAASLSNRTGEARRGRSSGQHQPVIECVRLAGFVELSGDDRVQLLTGGRGVLLTGATDRVTPHDGLEVVVSGQFMSPDVFRVDSVSRLPAV
jgi:hypothetical protein